MRAAFGIISARNNRISTEKPCTFISGHPLLYKKNRNIQTSLDDFNQPMGLKLNPDNQWIQKADMIPWDEIEDKYADLFPSKTGTVAKPLRMALGSLLIQKEFGFSDPGTGRTAAGESVLPVFHRAPRLPDGEAICTISLGRIQKAPNADVLNDINEMIIRYNKKDGGNGSSDGSGSGPDSGKDNNGTLILTRPALRRTSPFQRTSTF